MGRLKSKPLVNFCMANYADVRVVGNINPSVIVKFNGVGHVIYRPINQQNASKYVICKGEDRFNVNSLDEIKTIIR